MGVLSTLSETSLDERVGGGGGDAALVLPVPGHLDVAPVAPRLAPRVLDEEVAGAVADGEHAVVERLRAAVGLVVDAVRVELEGEGEEGSF